MKKVQYPLLFTLIGCIILCIIHCPAFNIFYDDKEIFKYTGQVILKGGVPYKNFFDHKPPLIFFLNYFGLLLGSWGLWILDSLMVIVSTLFFFRLCRNRIPFPWMLPLLYNIMLRLPYVSNGIGMTREYTSILLLLLFCTLMSNHRKKYLFAGILSSLIFFMQQDQVLAALPYLVIALIGWLPGEKKAPTFSRVLTCATGFLLIAVPLLLYFIMNGALQDFWYDAFLFNFNWYTEKISIIRHAVALNTTLGYSGYSAAFYGSLILALASLFAAHRYKKLLIAALLGVILAFSAEYLSGKLVAGLAVSYYLLPLAATIPILLLVIFAYSDLFNESSSRHQLIYGLIFSLPILIHIGAYVRNLQINKKNLVESSAEGKYFKDIALRDYDLYVFYNSNAVFLYNQHHILSPSKWIYHYFWHWYPNWDADQKILESIEHDLTVHQTKYILDCSDSATFRNPESSLNWKNFMMTNYEPVNLVNGRNLIWKIKSDAKKE